ncbi:class I SAM-dependent methyltransferase [Candidatus Haliotispira prima]|uniref:Class I SAM-dependent methyltransferase n=1 Tax=Candidatus Haliotispira prima TaxID=3034016 RepID=A0ABY8MJ89_9SPIO|nr:class I SAM-dependent methyltransferase [Candidatus Haliotispira prima]
MQYSKEIVEKYVETRDEYPTHKCIFAAVEKYLPHNGSVLELGSGSGADYAVLQQNYRVTGSDYSPEFLAVLHQRFQQKFYPLDARTLDIPAGPAPFDAIFSNKVLHHLNLAEVKQSFVQQARILNNGGLALHCIWQSSSDETEEEDAHGLPCYSYTRGHITQAAGGFELLEAIEYPEFEEKDSLLLILKKRN